MIEAEFFLDSVLNWLLGHCVQSNEPGIHPRTIASTEERERASKDQTSGWTREARENLWRDEVHKSTPTCKVRTVQAYGVPTGSFAKVY